MPHEVCALGFSFSSPCHGWINFQIDRAKSTLGPGTKFRASKVIQDNVVKNESPQGLYFHHEPPPSKKQVCLSVMGPRPALVQRRQGGFPVWSCQASYPKRKACSFGRLLPAHLEHWTPALSRGSCSPVITSREGYKAGLSPG